MKKKLFATALLLLTTCTSFTGCHYHTRDNTTMIQTKNRESTANNYIDMNRVTEYSGTDTGLQLYFEDGTGYYLEVPQRQEGITKVYYIYTPEDLECLSHALENRNEKIIIKVSNGTVLDSEGNGVDILGNYRHYDMKNFSVGDKVQSVFVYNPKTNFIDDILYRTDTLIE